ncbi:uncharacterized protein RCC_04306 [Ramularia collo-cygni]|uniref:T6SS Phospholipase effector Tle1-like catalytic domain-containing protein n=1 Tax=Ramularia collo-cygni TaxID=112498 RepID=A0A2D3UR96_9PEZI|nr:uncharacterized protein RCC_04306 [Ramularia collo-cygni]CZT18461.1 uncharacterized protein RCC_04306 [Ramularia collo-cygni]
MAHTRELAVNKRIIVCCDGTWLASDLGDGSIASNVAKLARAISPNGLDEAGRLIKQVVFYQSGIGSGDLPFQKAIYGGLGLGLDADVTQCYEFITNNYAPGDELFFFGFSRGAFTARSVAGLISNVGVLSSRNMVKFPELWKAYRMNAGGQLFRSSKWYLENAEKLGLRVVQIKAIGVWETVGALGIPEWPLVSKLQSLGLPINKEFAFHDTALSENIEYAFQALAIDEKRFTFPPTIWHALPGGPSKELKQCWFPGVHSNISGGVASEPGAGDHEEIGDNTFAWMVDNVSNMLTFEESSIDAIVEHHKTAIEAIKVKDGWGCGKIVDNFAGIQGLFFRLLGRQIRTPGAYTQDPGDGSRGATNEKFHPIVRVRKAKVAWNPPALAGYNLDEPDGKGSPWVWRKDGVQPLPEYVMWPDKRMSVSYCRDGQIEYKTVKSLSRRLCPSSILQELDETNAIVLVNGEA